MSILRSATVALSAAAFAAALATGPQAQAADHPAAARMVSQTIGTMDTSQRVASGSTTPGQGWVSYANATGLYIDVDTSSAHFTGTPTYTSSVGGIGGQWALTGTGAIYSPTATGFRIYVRWYNGSSITPAQAQTYQWYVNWIGVDNP
jgi:hypothetical protein